MPTFDFPSIPSSLKIVVLGVPVPKGRHRARIVTPRFKAPFIQFYQDSDTEKYEARIKQESALVMRGRGNLIGALDIHIEVYLPVPASWSNKQRDKALTGILRPVSRPDADNYAKAAMDAMNEIVYKDDAQVVDMRVSKHYSDNPRLEIEIFAA